MSHERDTDTDTYRARIVEALRREADRIEAGGDPACFVEGAGFEHAMVDLTMALSCIEEGDDPWLMEEGQQTWGVCVIIQAVIDGKLVDAEQAGQPS